MKNIVYTIVISALMIAGAAQEASAQKKCDGNWKEKMMSEKIAFLTVELDITPEEALKFWPVYNKIGKELDEARHNVMKTYKALATAVEGGKSPKELSSLTDEYVQAKIRQDEMDNATAEAYRKVLPVEKVAKLYVAEEKFRRQYIHKLHHKPEGKK